MPWASKEKSLRAVRGCFGAAGTNTAKRKKCRRMAHEARLWRKGKKSRVARKGRKA